MNCIFIYMMFALMFFTDFSNVAAFVRHTPFPFRIGQFLYFCVPNEFLLLFSLMLLNFIRQYYLVLIPFPYIPGYSLYCYVCISFLICSSTIITVSPYSFNVIPLLATSPCFFNTYSALPLRYHNHSHNPSYKPFSPCLSPMP